MSKFDRQLRIIEEDIFEGASDEEVEERKEKGREILLKERLEVIKSRSSVNSDGSLDVEGSVNLSFLRLKEIPLKFNKVNGFFDCSYNQLTSLEGCPKIVNGNFYCSSNQLTSLEGSPKIINDFFSCDNNELTSLKGCPKEVNRVFSCVGNKVKFTEEDVRKHCNVKGIIYV